MQPPHSDPDIESALKVLRDVIADKDLSLSMKMDAVVKLSALKIKLTPDIGETAEEVYDRRALRAHDKWIAVFEDGATERKELVKLTQDAAEQLMLASVRWQRAREAAGLDAFWDVG